MMSTAVRHLRDRLRCRIEFEQPLAPYTTYRIGGPAAAVVHPERSEDVVQALRFAAEVERPWLAIGLGSNLLVSDRGFAGIVIRLGKGLDRVTDGVDGEATVWRIEAGFPTPQLARRSARAGLSGVHRLVGIPGTVGGGVFMNAGAHGQDFSQVVRHVELVDPSYELRRIPSQDIAWRYRGSGLGGHVVLAATIELAPAERARLEDDIRQHFQWRKAGTPFNEPCCGSVFRNPASSDGGGERPAEQRQTAGQLIDACGLKGFRIGGAQVSTTHANYIVNTGRATSDDVRRVIDAVRTRVRREFGVDLQLEVQIVE